MARSDGRPRGPRRTEDVLGDALGIWAETRARVIAEAIDALTDERLASWRPPHPRSRETLQRQWIHQLRTPVGRGWAARSIVDGLSGYARARALDERLRALAEAAPDPRVGHAVAEHAIAGTPGFEREDLAPVLEAILARCLDERVQARLEAARDEVPPELAAVFDRVLDRASDRAPWRPPTADELARVAPGPRAAVPVHAGALLAEVYADPRADEPRLVLADALQAAGDPRGELIALQLAERGGSEPRRCKQIDKLLRAHGLDWLGPLRRVALRVQFEGGFPVRLEMDHVGTLDPAELAELGAAPEAATLEEIVPGHAMGFRYLAFASGRGLRALRSIEVYDIRTVELLDELAPRLEHVAYGMMKRPFGDYLTQLERLVLPRWRRAPRLRSIAISIAGAPLVLASPLALQLGSLALAAGQVGSVLALRPQLPRSCDLVAVARASLEPCTSKEPEGTGEIRLGWQGDALVARARGTWGVATLARALDALPAIARLEVDGGSEAARAELERAARGRPFELVLRPPRIRSGYLAGGNR